MPFSQGILVMVKSVDATNPNPDDDKMCYKRGDFVALYPPGTEFVSPPAVPFYILDVTGVPLTYEEVLARYMQQDTTNGRRRLYYVNLDTLPNANKADLVAQRWTQITWQKLRSSVKNKVTGASE